MDDLEKELKISFLDEATQLLADAEQCFLSLEGSAQNLETYEKIFRLAHTLKGGASAVGFVQLGEFMHRLETFLLKLKKGELAPDSTIVNLLLRCNDQIAETISCLRGDLSVIGDYSVLIQEINAISTTKPNPRSQSAPANLPAPSSARSVRGADENIRVSLRRLDKLIDFVGEMAILQTVLNEQAPHSDLASLQKTLHQLNKVTKEVQELAMGLRMVSVKSTLQKLIRVVRDTSSELGKKVQLHVQGEETELDKSVLDHLGDPLVHLIRNAIDHGIETPEVRRNMGKDETGIISLVAFQHSGRFIVEIADDGAGLDADKLRAQAVQRGLIAADSALSDSEAHGLIFRSGFSTKREATPLSGRGVGMDIVKTNVEQLQGDIQVDTTLGKGCRFRVRLPLTLAIIEGLVIASGAERFVIPLVHVHESVRAQAGDIYCVSGLGEILALRGEHLPLYRLNHLLGREPKSSSIHPPIAIVVRLEKQPFAVLIDEIVGQYQVVVKSLGSEYSGLKGYSGSAILGDGLPSLILELPELIKHAPMKTEPIAPQQET